MRLLQRLELRRYGEAISDTSLDLLVGLAAGIALGAAFGWRRSKPLDNDWQRGVIAVLSAVGALLIAFFFAIPAEHFFGLGGLAVLALAAAALGARGSRWAVQGSGQHRPEPGP